MIEIKVPATSANIGSGFDSLGIALGMYNTVQMELWDKVFV
ncbi:MAG: homoserine kinase, partial [Angelakisella sp.]